MGIETSNEDFVHDGQRDSIKGSGFAIHRTAKLEEIKAQTLGTTDMLGTKGCPIKIEDFVKTEMKQEIGDHFTLGASSSSSSRVKKEEDVVKEEPIKQEPVKEEPHVKEDEDAARQPTEGAEGTKRERENDSS